MRTAAFLPILLTTTLRLTAATAVKLTLIDGDAQMTTAGAAITAPRVSVTGANGSGCDDVAVTFVATAADGRGTAAIVRSSSGGLAVAPSELLTPPPGVHIVIAYAGLADPVRLHTLSLAQRPAVLTMAEGSGGLMQPAATRRLRVRLTRGGAPVEGVPVHWRVIEGGGSLSTISSTTDPSGHADAHWTIGPRRGVQSVTATTEGSPSAWAVVIAAEKVLDVVRDYRAPADGFRDATGAIQHSLNAAADAGGGVVYLPPGTYRVEVPLSVGSNVHLVGAGSGVSTLRAPQVAGTVPPGMRQVAVTVMMPGSSHASVTNLTVDHATRSAVSNGIAVVPASHNGGPVATNCTIAETEVIGSGNVHAYMIWNLRGRGIRILNNRVDGRSEGFGATHGHNKGMQEGIESYGGAEVLVAGNDVRNINGAGINFGSSGLGSTLLEDAVAENNTTENCWRGASVYPSIGTHGPQNIRNVAMRNNIFRDSWTAGIYVALFPGTSIEGLSLTHNEIDGVRHVLEGSGHGIELRGEPEGTPAMTRDVVIAGNLVRGTTARTAAGLLLAYFPDVTVRENIVTGLSAIGIQAFAAPRLELMRNVIANLGSAAITSDYGASPQTIIGNIIWNWDQSRINTPAIHVSGAEGGTIQGQRLFRSDVSDAALAIAPSSRQVTVRDNVLLTESTYDDPVLDHSTW